MRVRFGTRPTWVMLLLLASAPTLLCGCSQTEYRLQADAEAYETIEERNEDSRWATRKIDIDLDPRSRYFDPYDPDHSPMPLDDPTSQRYMHVVDDLEAWEHWRENGVRSELENPQWRNALGEYVETAEDGTVKLDINSALRLAYVHSPNHQRQLETLYLSALDVSEERFNLDTRFFGGYGLNFANSGKLAGNSNQLTVGRLGRGRNSSALFAERRFSTAGELLVGFANSFVFEFSGGDTNLSQSLVNFVVTQPLLRGAGRDIALEGLTADERKLLANLRAYSQFRQGFYTNIAIGDLGVVGPSRGQTSTNLTSFSGAGGVNGYAGLLQQVQRIRNTQDNLNLQSRTLERLVALYDNELIDIVQVDQFRQDIERQRANLLATRNSLELELDRYKTNTLGLPPDLEIELDESLIRKFQLIPRQATETLSRLAQLQKRIGDVSELVDMREAIATLDADRAGLAVDSDVAVIRTFLEDVQDLTETAENRSNDVGDDFKSLSEQGASTEPEWSAGQQADVDLVKQHLDEGPDALKQLFESINERLETLQDDLVEETKAEIIQGNSAWLQEVLRKCQGVILIQSRVRKLSGEPKTVLEQSVEFVQPIQELLETTRDDMARMIELTPKREETMSDEAKKAFREERQRLAGLFQELESAFSLSTKQLQMLRDQSETLAPSDVMHQLVIWAAATLERFNRLALIPAQARLETITVDPIELQPHDALHTALTNRLDFMNGRAALVDRWRAIQVNADALQSVLNITGGGDLRTARNNPLSFRAPTGSVRLGLEFDAPFTRLLERNAYRESLIEYQRNRRSLIQSRDGLHLGLRALLRNLEQLRQNLEIQRRAVSIAMRRVDQTQLSLNPARNPVQPGQRPPINPTTAINLLGAQTSLRDSQNAFLSAWLNHYATRLRLYRELGIMQLDPEGRWIELPLEDSPVGDAPAGGAYGEATPDDLPPSLPDVWLLSPVSFDTESYESESISETLP